MAEAAKKVASPKPATEESTTVETAKPEPRPFISEGVRDEIERLGTAVNPATGQVLTRKDLQ